MKSFLERKFYILIALFGATIYISNDAFLPAIEQIAKDMSTTKGSVEQAVTAFVGGSLALLLFMGPLSDKYGRKKTIIISGIVFLFSNFYCGYTSNLHGLLIARLFSGSSMALVGASGFSAINEYYEEKEALKALSYTVNLTVLAPLLGPIIGAYILKFTNSWRNVFYYDNVAMAIVLILIVFYMPETNKDIIIRKIRKKQSKNKELTDKEKIYLADTHDAHKNTSMTDKFRGMIILLKNPTFVAFSMCAFFVSYSFMIWITGSRVLLGNLGQNPEQYSLWQIPVFAGMIIGNNVALLLYRRIGVFRTINITVILMPICGIMMFVSSYYFGYHPLGLVVPFTFFLFARGLQNAPLNQFLLSMTNNFKGSAGSLSGLIGGVGSILGSYTASKLADAENIHTVLIMSIGMCVTLIVGLIGRVLYNHNHKKVKV